MSQLVLQTRSIVYQQRRKALVLILATLAVAATGCQTLVSPDGSLPASGRIHQLLRSGSASPHWGVDPRARKIESNLDAIEHSLP